MFATTPSMITMAPTSRNLPRPLKSRLVLEATADQAEEHRRGAAGGQHDELRAVLQAEDLLEAAVRAAGP